MHPEDISADPLNILSSWTHHSQEAFTRALSRIVEHALDVQNNVFEYEETEEDDDPYGSAFKVSYDDTVSSLFHYELPKGQALLECIQSITMLLPTADLQRAEVTLYLIRNDGQLHITTETVEWNARSRAWSTHIGSVSNQAITAMAALLMLVAALPHMNKPSVDPQPVPIRRSDDTQKKVLRSDGVVETVVFHRNN